jgi:peptide/nickel transport system substrate-binding protein
MSPIKRLRFLIRLTNAFIAKWKWVISMGIILGIGGYFSLPKLIKYLPQPQKTIKIGILGKFNLQEIPSDILIKLSRGLTKVDNDGNLLPDLASNWTVSPDGKIYTFYFDQKYFWSDGSEFVTDDINYNFKEAKIMPIDFRTVKVKLDEQYVPFPSIVSQLLFKKGLIGLGEYRIGKIERSGQVLKSILLEPIKDKSLAKLLYRFYTNNDYLKLAFKLGEIDIIDNLSSETNFTGWKNISYSSKQNDLQQLVLFFNNKKDPFSEKNFRQAIAYSIQKTNDKSRSLGPISHISWVYNPGIKKYEKDLNNAKLLLKNIKIKPEAVFKINTFPNLETEANKIKKQLDEIGLKTEINLTPFSPEDFDMLLAIMEIPKDPDQYSFWHTAQEGNITNFSNPRIDKLLEEGRKTTNLDDRKKIYLDFQRFLVEESPAVFLYYPSYFRLERN